MVKSFLRTLKSSKPKRKNTPLFICPSPPPLLHNEATARRLRKGRKRKSKEKYKRQKYQKSSKDSPTMVLFLHIEKIYGTPSLAAYHLRNKGLECHKFISRNATKDKRWVSDHKTMSYGSYLIVLQWLTHCFLQTRIRHSNYLEINPYDASEGVKDITYQP